MRVVRLPVVSCLRHSSRFAASTDVVVCGGGLTGASVALHLARRGKRVYIVEKKTVGAGGATAMCAGLVSAPVFWRHPTCQQLAQRSLRLYEELADIKAFEYSKCGRLFLASSDRSRLMVERMLTRGKLLGGVEQFQSIEDLKADIPFINTEKVKLAALSTEDVVLDAVSLCQEMVAEAVLAGARLLEGVQVVEVLLGHERQVYAVDTSEGLVETPVFVDCAGINAGHIPVRTLTHGRVQLATYPGSYQYLSVSRLPTSLVLAKDLPIINDLDGNVMIQANSIRTVCMGFDEETVRVSTKKAGSWTQLESDWDKFEPVLGRSLEVVPMLGEIPVGDLLGGLESFSSDGSCCLGECSQAKGYFVATGMCGQGLSLAGGVGELIADWIVDGKVKKDVDVSRVDVSRFLDLHANQHYLMERTPEVASLTYRNARSGYQFHSARNLRMCPIHQQLREAGAVFGEVMGYERPLWFEPKGPEKSLFSGSAAVTGRPPWFSYVASEYAACRERVGVIDMSSFSKFEISGSDSVRLLQYLCSADIDRPVGTTVYTGMHNEDGGYVTDCTLSRLAEERFFMVAPTIQQERVFVWLKQWAQKKKVDVHVRDVTSAYTALDLVGPLSRHLLSDLTETPVTTNDFPAFRCRDIEIGMATGIRAISVTHCGELGWVLYIPNEMAQNVYERIIEAGREYSLAHAGYFALRHLRIEKFYVYWGQDIDATVTPVECGRTFRVNMEKEFIGKTAIEKQRDDGIFKRFVHIMIDGHNVDEDPWPEGGEVIYRDGRPVGRTTSSAYGFTLGCQVCIGVVYNESGITVSFVGGGTWEVEIAGRRYPCRLSPHSPNLPMESSEHPSHYRPTQ